MTETEYGIAKIRFLTESELRFTKKEGGFLSLQIGERFYRRVMVQRAFPLSQPTRYISVREVREDREPGEEIGMIEDLQNVLPELRTLLCEELDMRYFTPLITKIHKLKEERGFVYIDADTSAGARKIIARNNSASFIHLSGARILILDVDGNRYDIPDTGKLDKKSAKNLEVIV